MNNFLSIDQGTTSSRSILFNNQGKILSLKQKEFKQIYPQSGWVEHDPEEIWKTTIEVIKSVCIETNLNSIKAAGITNQRETTLIWNRKTGIPIYNAIVWQDRRTANFCEDLINNSLEKVISEKTGLLIDPYFSASKIAWILDNVDGARQSALNGELAFGTIDSFLLWRLTGGKVHATDATNASRTSLYNINTLEWDDELLKVFNVPKNILPEVKDSAFEYGHISKEILGISIPILSILGDQQAAAIGQSCFKEGTIKSTYGTGAFLILNTGKNKIKSKSRLLSTICYKLNNQATYALEGSIFNTGTIIQWLRDDLQFFNNAEETESLAESVRDNNNLFFIPAFTGLGCPYWDPSAKGAIYGITRDTSKSMIIRAALESVALQTNDIFSAMSADGIKPNLLRVDGGMTNNFWLMQYLSNILNIKVEKPKITETTALGTAMLSAFHYGEFTSLENISMAWELDQRFEPKMEISFRNNKIKQWKYYIGQTLTK